METALILVIVVAASSLTKVRALPTGAPLGACDNLTPSPTNHGAQPRGTLSPYFIELSPLNGGYTSGQTYEREKSCTLYIEVTCGDLRVAGYQVPSQIL